MRSTGDGKRLRILAVADLHGKPERLAALEHLTEKRRPDVVVVAGDAAPRRRLMTTFTGLSRLGPPVYVVRGNSEGRGFDRLVKGFTALIPLTTTPLSCGGVHLAGLGGTLPLPLASRIGWWEGRRLNALRPLPAPGVLVVHPPPYGVLDEVLGGWHAGSRGLARWIVRHPPALVLCGHIHERPGVATIGATTVINCAVGHRSSGALIDMGGGNLAVEMLPPVISSASV